MKTSPIKIHNNPSDIASRVLLFTLLWVILSGGSPLSWTIGAPAILLAVIASTMLVPPVSLAWSEIPAFIGFFLIRSLAGGADVAWRALHPHMPIAPDLITYPLRIPPGLPQVFMVNTISLLPGTLSVELITEMNQSSLTVHVLDRKKQIAIELESVEHRVARLFGVPLPVASQRQD